ncbi:DUF732 domain-containing protein [Mycobacterium sp. E2238]|uniref:DUF732 domain-containing protein n=1 Tax=Mycobacterium sp. E2238 TaxID=1834131 RepID=UPI0009EE25A5|nr:DUF732 domain-containing protein [Mycobacterium sp. E2238]
MPQAPTPRTEIADAAFIAALKHEGVPVPSHEYVMTQGHAVCDFLAHQPNFADAVEFVRRSRFAEWALAAQRVWARAKPMAVLPTAGPMNPRGGPKTSSPPRRRRPPEITATPRAGPSAAARPYAGEAWCRFGRPATRCRWQRRFHALSPPRGETPRHCGPGARRAVRQPHAITVDRRAPGPLGARARCAAIPHRWSRGRAYQPV